MGKYAIEMLNITKSFNEGKLIANNDISFSVKENEIHAIIGENGAGKSTLMSILFGLYQQDKGTIKIRNKKVKFKSAQDATKYKIGMVHQHFKLIDAYTVWENIIIGFEKTYKIDNIDTLTINRKLIKKELNQLIKHYKLDVDLDAKVADVSVGTQQKVEILKLLYNSADILIFDEPTAILSDEGIANFLKILTNFKKEKKTIIIITHKLHEVKAIADRATVLRQGKIVARFNVKDKTVEEMAEAMVGRKIQKVVNEQDFDKNDVILSVSNLWIKDKLGKDILKNINFKVRRGEIFGIAGVEGNGQSELALTLAGLIFNNYGSIKAKGIEITNLNIKKRSKNLISHVPEDRHKYGLFLDATVSMNCIPQIISNKKFGFEWWLKKQEIDEYSKKIIKKFNVVGANNGAAIARQLSGGNQQKLIIGREMTRKHDLLILVNPTRGLDIGAINLIQKLIIKEISTGKAVILISYDLDEIMSLSSTIAVMSDKTITKIASIKNITRNEIGVAMTKHTDFKIPKNLRPNKKTNNIQEVLTSWWK